MNLSIENDLDFQMSPKNLFMDIDNILNLIDNDTDTQSMISFINILIMYLIIR